MNPDLMAILSHRAAMTQSNRTHATVFTFSLVVEFIDATTDTEGTDGEAQAAPKIERFLIQITLQLAHRAGETTPGRQAANWVLEAGAEVIFVTVLFEEVKRSAGH